MYADRYAGRSRFNPAGLTGAIAVNAAVVVALMFAGPHVVRVLPDDPLKIIDVFVPTPPPPEPVPKPVERSAARPNETISAPRTEVATASPFTLPELPALPPLPPADPIGIGPAGPAAADPPAPLPLPFVAPSVDERYASALQPPYPPSERRAGNEGRVAIRVLIGVDGRVKQAMRVSATNDAFWQAAERQALSRWRFRPATRGGIPVEAWRTMTLSFVLEE